MLGIIEEPKKKICTGCNVNLLYNKYHKLTKKNGRVTVQAMCKECTSEYKKKRYWANHDVELAKMTKSRLKPENTIQRKGYYENNKEDYRSRYRGYMLNSEKRRLKKENGAKYEKLNADKISKRKKLHNQKESVKARKRIAHQKRKREDINYNIKRRLRFRLRHVVNYLGDKKYKLKSAVDLLGCDMLFFKTHIESKFTEGMSWGRLSEIDIDHIIPCVKFDLTKLEEQKKCFHWSNLQPLWHLDNLRKGTFYQEQKIAS